MKWAIQIAIVLTTWTCFGAEKPAWKPSLAYGAASDCPEHNGRRTNTSEVAEYRGVKAYIEGAATRQGKSCEQKVAIHWITRDGKRHEHALDAKDSQYVLVDFSSSGSELLVQWDKDTDEGRGQEQVSLGVLSLSTGDLRWKSVWQEMGWKECWATVEAQGYLSDGRPVIRPRPSIHGSHPGGNCVTTPVLYAWKWETGAVEKLPDDIVVRRVGREIDRANQPCRTDPDIVGECFWTHGRASYFNGGPSLRIWRIGTDRMLGVTTEQLPKNAAALIGLGNDFFVNDVYGDFQVCPFEKQKPGHMQPVCVESAKNLVLKKR